MKNAATSYRVYTFPSAMYGVESRPDSPDPAPTSLGLSAAVSAWPAVSWLSSDELETGERIALGYATVVDARSDGPRDPLVLVDWNPSDHIDPLDVVPLASCPADGTVAQVRDMVRAMSSVALRQFMASVFTLTDVFRWYWTCPASIAHHHRGPGGLATHSLEVAVAASSVHGLAPWQRDLVVAHALLHDIGKLWSYSEGRLTDEAERVGHEQVGYRHLAPMLVALSADNPSEGALLNALLRGDWRKNCKHPTAALGNIVRAMDQFSVARFNDRQASSSTRWSLDVQSTVRDSSDGR